MWRSIRHRAALIFLTISEFFLGIVGRRRPYGIVRVDLSGDLVEGPNEQRVLGFLRRSSEEYLGVITLLRWARDDARVTGVLICCGDLRVSWARLQGLRRAIEKLRAAGKRVWVQLSHAGVGEYYLATAAEQVSLAPPVSLDVTGLSSEAVFLLGALEKIGVQADVVQMGRYKSAGETFTRRGMSESHREMMESLIDDLYGQLVDAIAGGRGLEPAAVRDLLDRGPFLGDEAVAAKLVDRRSYTDEIEAQLVEQCNGATVLDHSAYSRRRGRQVQRDVLRKSRGTFALLNVTGTIKTGESVPGPDGATATGGEPMRSALEEVRERDDIRAVVIRISSPGGSGVASDLIWHEVMRTREKKPVVVSCGDLAASGGYYIAVAGSPIFAEAGTITGSIGVIAGKANLRGLYDRVGISKEIVSRGKHANIYSDYVPLGNEEKARIQAEAESFYRMFVDRVATSRRLTTEAVGAVAEGRVWTGRQAWTRGLIDELGGIDDAFDAAKTLVGLAADEPVLVERFPRPRRLWKLSLDLSMPTWGPFPELLSLPPMLRLVLRERVWTLLPFHFRFF